MRTRVAALTGLLMLSHAGGLWAAPAAEPAPCTRQTAIWQHLFHDGDGMESTPPCRPVANWFGNQGVISAAAPAPASPSPLGAAASAAVTQAPAQTPRPMAVEYSHAYEVRRKIHYYASFATIPLFVTQYILGDKLFDDENRGGSTKSAHSAAAVGIEALFGVNSVTGVWNMWEARKDPNGRKLRLTHGLLMLGADAGFVATGLLAPEDGDRSGRSTHRNVAIGSMAVSTVSYLIMLIGR